MMPAVSKTQDHSNPLLGIAFKLVSVVCLSGMAACVKQLGTSLPVAQIVFFRGLIAIAVLAVVARSLAGSLSMFCWFAALAMIPLAQMTAISFTIPLFLTVLAMVFLGERIHAYRWTALGIGFAGVLIIVAPELAGGGGNVLGVSISLLAAVLAAFALLFLRRMSGHEHALTITFYFFVTSTSIALLTMDAARHDWSLWRNGAVIHVLHLSICRSIARCPARLRQHADCDRDWLLFLLGDSESDDLGRRTTGHRIRRDHSMA
jgi:drug/metabolite transporter (DMT)-like permease